RPFGVRFVSDPNAGDTQMGVEHFWFIAFGDYMTETRGEAMLQEPFVSPTDRSTKAVWNAYRSLPFTERNASEDGHFLVVPTYAYTLPALFNRRVFTIDGPLNPMGG